MKQKTKHILNYKILQEWGFMWAIKRNDGCVTSYCTKETYHTDMFDLRPLSLMFLDENFNRWHLTILDDDADAPLKDLFYGQLNDDNLEIVLKAIMIWKPNDNTDK
jgi:hypothetical protein